jgi:hypothetical protein
MIPNGGIEAGTEIRWVSCGSQISEIVKLPFIGLQGIDICSFDK